MTTPAPNLPQDVLDLLYSFETLSSDDSVKTDLELTCRKCKEVVCDVEHGDDLAILASAAVEHLPECTG